MINNKEKKVCVFNWRSRKWVRRVAALLTATRWNLWRALHSMSWVEDDWQVVDMTAAKEVFVNYLTKAGASPEVWQRGLQAGECETPTGAQDEDVQK